MENEKVSSIKQVNVAILNGGSLSELLKKVKASRQEMADTTKKLIEKENAIKRKREEEKERLRALAAQNSGNSLFARMNRFSGETEEASEEETEAADEPEETAGEEETEE